MSVQKKTGEKSFTLLETLIALGLMVAVIAEVSTIQGNAINFSNYGRKMTQAAWLAKSVMSTVEYKWQFYDFKEFEIDKKDETFSPQLCLVEEGESCPYRYNLSIKEWKLPLLDILLGTKSGNSDGDEGEENPISAMIKSQLKEILGDNIIKVAHVEVFWPEGSRKDKVELAYLLTAQKKLDEKIESLEPIQLKKGKEKNK